MKDISQEEDPRVFGCSSCAFLLSLVLLLMNLMKSGSPIQPFKSDSQPMVLIRTKGDSYPERLFESPSTTLLSCFLIFVQNKAFKFCLN